MIIEDEESLQMYVEESLEHMSNIENNLLSIEKAGDNPDEEIVNEVFRAAHSIKGGAGLMGLNNIKELAHKVENVLGLIREKKVTPDSKIISIVLSAFDKLNNMINHIRESEEIDISEEVVSLTGLTTASLPEAKKSSVGQLLHVFFEENGKPVFTTTRYDFDESVKGGRELYIIKWDLIRDIQDNEKSLIDIMKTISASGNIIDSTVDIEGVGTLEDAVPDRVPFMLLYSTLIGEDILPALFNVNKKNIRRVTSKLVRPIGDMDTPVDEPLFATKPEPAQPQTPEPEPDVPPARPSVPPVETESAIEETVVQPTNTMETDLFEPDPEEAAITDNDGGAEDKLKPFAIKSPQMQTSLRVDVKLLDNLMTLAGEMVLSRNQLLQNIAAGNVKSIAAAGQRINMVTSELQDVIMRTRMQSIGNIFNKFPRLVRDMSQTLGKKIELTLEGADVELDKTIIEAISDPLTHLIRNSVDHGIEPPGKRSNLGKNPIGRIHLAALHEAGQVTIEITDDGNGIDGNEIAAAALRKGLILENQAAGMTQKEKMDLILLPGFSTASRVTDVSGRGVGMDVVKTNLDKLGGSMDIEAVLGSHTTITIKLPLTLAIIPSQIVLVGEEKYAIPQVNLDELLRIPADQVKHRIEKVGDAEVVRLRGKLLPLVDLARVLGVEKTFFDPVEGIRKLERRQNIADRRSKKISHHDDKPAKEPDKHVTMMESGGQTAEQPTRRLSDDRRYRATSAINIAVVSLADMKYGLVVDRLLDSEEIVVKPLGKHLKQCQEFSGATIMGDGKVSLILDVAGIADSAELNIVDISRKEKKEEIEKLEAQKIKDEKEIASLLIFSNDVGKERFAVSLGLVERIESIKTTAIEDVGGKQVIQYRGGALPLFSIDQVASVKPLPEVEEIEVIVFTIGGREIGLMVVPPVDAVEVPINIDSKALKQPGIIGSAIINSRTTLILDIFEAVKTLYPDWMDTVTKKQIKTGGSGTLLFVEDSDFFRRQVKGFLEDGGFQVIEAKDGQEGWSVLTQEFEGIDLIITDLEMPKMNGFELTEKIKNDDRFKHFPVIALTSLAGEADIIKGKQVGITDYQIKMDRGKLLETVKRYIGNDQPSQ